MSENCLNTEIVVEKKWLNPISVAALLLIIIFTALIIHREKRSRSMWELLPTTTALYFSAPINRQSEWNEMPIFNGTFPVPFLLKDLRSVIFANLPSEIREPLPKIIDRYGSAMVAVKNNDQWRSDEIIFFACNNAWDIKKLFTNNSSTRINLLDFTDAYQTELNDKKYFFALLKPYAVFTESVEVLAEIIQTWQKKITPLNDFLPVEKFTYDPNERIEYFIRSDVSSIIGEIWVKNNQYQSNGFFCEIPRNEQRALVGVIDNLSLNENATVTSPTSTRGIFYYFAWTIGIIIAIVIGAPVLFLATVMLFALYFHIVSRLKGENVPTVAPQLAELPEEMAKDLQT